MAEWYRVKFNDERKLTESSETIDPPDDIKGYSSTIVSRSDLNNGEIARRKLSEESLIEKRRSSNIAPQNAPRETKHHKSRDAASIVLNSIVKDDSRFQKNSDQIGILSEELSKSLSNQSYENDLVIDKFEDEEERRCLEKTYNGYEDPGSRIREEARQELKKLSKSSGRRPVSMHKEDVVVSGSQKRKNLVTVRRSISPTRILSGKRRLSSEKSIEKLVNGSSSREDKQQHHVQFNKDSKKQYSRDERSQPTPSIPTSAISTSEDNSSLGQLCEGTPPDGGWGWVVVVAAFIVNLIGDGVTFSFGVIYVEFLNYFDEGKFKTAWIGSIFMAMPLLCGPVASFLTDRYGCRRVCIAGSILATTGFVITSYANSMAVLVFTFGILPGFGLSLCFVTAVVIVAYYFDKKRSFATGLSGCGSGIGTFICAPLTQYLLDEYGWRGTTLILGGLFLQLAVCGCLMRDPEWTTTRARAKTEERRKNREKKRSRIQSSSVDSFSANCSLNTLTIMEKLRLQGEDDEEKLFSSLVSLPTFVNTGEKVPSEVLELLSTRKNVYNVLVQNYPNLLIPSRRFSDSGALHDQLCIPSSARYAITPSSLSELKTEEESKDKALLNDNQTIEQQADDAWRLWWSKKISLQNRSLRRSSTPEHSRRIPPGFLKDIRMHKRSLTYRGAMLNMNRLRASSCPDIYRNSMTTSTKTKLVWCAGLWDLLLDMVDFSHFADSRFLLFAISNFLLHTWYDVPYVYLTDNAIEMGFSETDASNLISVIGITNTVGEVLLGWAGDRAWLNASIVYAVCMAFCGAVTALIPKVVRNYYLLCVISGAFGLFISANCSLTSIILVELITLERFANAYGLLLLVQGVANLVGPPLAGWLYDITGKYDLSFYLAGLCIALSGVLLLAMPLISLYRKCVYGSKKEETDKEFSSLNSVYISRGSSRSIQNEGKL